MGRLHHLKETLPRNLEDNKGHLDLEFVILDYNSPDNVWGWLKENEMEHLTSGRVAYWKESDAVRWKMPHAKNVAHLVSTGEIVCNLDADNFTGHGYAAMLSDLFTSAPMSIVTHFKGGGTGGRVAVRRTDFLALRGYDEELNYGWGWEDDDFKARARAFGLVKISIQVPEDGAIDHQDEERIRYMPEWKSLREAHSRQSEVFARRGSEGLVNPNGFGRAVVTGWQKGVTMEMFHR